MARQFKSTDTSVWPDGYGSGADGAYAPSTGTDAPIDSACTGTISTTSLSATNASFAAGQFILIHQTRGSGAGQWELNKIASYVAGTITLAYPLQFGYVTGAQVLVMPQYASGNIAGGVTITGKAWDGSVGGIYAKFCNGTFTIAGAIVSSAKGFRGGAGTTGNGVQLGTQIAFAAEGTSGATVSQNAANGNGGGGAWRNGTDQLAAGGGGGNGTTGTTGGSQSGSFGGVGGASSGSANLTTMSLGGGGGGGEWGLARR